MSAHKEVEHAEHIEHIEAYLLAADKRRCVCVLRFSHGAGVLLCLRKQKVAVLQARRAQVRQRRPCDRCLSE